MQSRCSDIGDLRPSNMTRTLQLTRLLPMMVPSFPAIRGFRAAPLRLSSTAFCSAAERGLRPEVKATAVELPSNANVKMGSLFAAAPSHVSPLKHDSLCN